MTHIAISETKDIVLNNDINVFTGTMDLVNSLTMMLYESMEGFELHPYEQLECFSIDDLTGEKGNILEKPEARLTAWQQQMLVLDIMNKYPGKMLVISTWSPLIINTVKPENIWVIHSSQEVYHPNCSYGLTAGQVCSVILGAESEYAPEIQAAIDEISLELHKEHYDRAEKLIDDLDKETNSAPIVHGLRTSLVMERGITCTTKEDITPSTM